MWEMLGMEAMSHFSLHIQGKLITCVVAHHSPLSVYNVAFALHCPDPVTPKGIDFCRSAALSRLYLPSLFSCSFSFRPHFSILSSPPISLFSPSFMHTNQYNQTNGFLILPDHHPSLSFISFAPLPSSFPSALLSCLFVLLLHASSPRPLLRDPSTMRPKFHLFPSVTLHSSFSLSSLVFTPSICLITQWFSFSLCALFVLTSTSFSCPPSALFVSPPPSVIPSSSSPSVSVYWVLSSTHSLVDKWFIFPRNPHSHLQTSLFNQLQLS